MVSRAALVLFSVCAITSVCRAIAEPAVVSVSILAGPLPDALQSLERQTGIDLLFDHDAVNGLQCPAVRGTLSAETALQEMVSQTGLTVRRAESGAWIVERPAAPPLTRPDAAVPEILVIGQRTQDADLPRVENDIQPYTIVTQEELLSAHRDDVGDYFNSRVPSNTHLPAATFSGADLSSIDLRGLGAEATLVLIDGRRLPNIPQSGVDFAQSDLNGIPLHAIDRIEVLTGAAGGIYGFGALGGVVNVVLDHDYRGLDLHVTEGITSRGDAWRQVLEASFGHSFEDGRTDFTVFASHSQADALLVGQRDFAEQERQRDIAVFGSNNEFAEPQGNSVSVLSYFSNLVLKPAYGGAALNSTYTYLPTGFMGTTSALATALLQNAGKVDPSISQGDAMTDLLPHTVKDSILMNLRHRFDGGVEAYADAIMLWNRAQSNDERAEGEAILSPDSPANPFNTDIQVQYPISGADLHSNTDEQTLRYTVGLISPLPFGWRGSAEATLGSLQFGAANTDQVPDEALFLEGDPSDLLTNPFGDWNTFQQAITANPGHIVASLSSRNRFQDDALRMAGPLFKIGDRPATLTLLGERRTENVPSVTWYDTSDLDDTPDSSPTTYQSHSSEGVSVYAELRAPLFGAHAAFPLLRGLELQLAVRRDDERDAFDLEGTGEAPTGQAHTRYVATAFTVGAKITPWDWLMVRASYATGRQPPPTDALIDEDEETTTVSLANDPKRGGQPLGTDGPYVYKVGGNQDLSAIRASTLFVGFTLTPLGVDGPRIAFDYSRIQKTNDVFIPTFDQILANEDYWPQRVTRGPLTAADQALGYTAGPVIAVDDLAANGAGLVVTSVDAHAEWLMPLSAGRLRLYGDATDQMSNRQTQLFQPDIESDGYLNGPLKWRANAGLDWSVEAITLGANVQYFGRYLVLQNGPLSAFNDLVVKVQGSDHVPSQVYLDLHAAWQLPIPMSSPAHDLKLEVGFINVLDSAPPRLTSIFNMGPAYSGYGDPRQRRFEVVLSHRF